MCAQGALSLGPLGLGSEVLRLEADGKTAPEADRKTAPPAAWGESWTPLASSCLQLAILPRVRSLWACCLHSPHPLPARMKHEARGVPSGEGEESAAVGPHSLMKPATCLRSDPPPRIQGDAVGKVTPIRRALLKNSFRSTLSMINITIVRPFRRGRHRPQYASALRAPSVSTHGGLACARWRRGSRPFRRRCSRPRRCGSGAGRGRVRPCAAIAGHAPAGTRSSHFKTTRHVECRPACVHLARAEGGHLRPRGADLQGLVAYAGEGEFGRRGGRARTRLSTY